jgi:hypothetical protein
MNTKWNVLEDEIVALYSQSFALEQTLLSKLRDFDKSEEWSRQHFVSCAHWLSFRVGLSLHAARERVRVARALETLPALDAKLKGGEISFSKVRELTRVATPETEVALLEVAENASGEQVRKLVRGLAHLDAVELAVQDDKRFCQMFFAEDGMCVVSARLRPEEGALLMKAVEAAPRGRCSARPVTLPPSKQRTMNRARSSTSAEKHAGFPPSSVSH